MAVLQEGMELAQGIEAVDLGLYVRKYNVLILADLHLGFEEHLARQGVLVPRQQFRLMLQRLGWILSRLPKLETIVLNGDLKHEFGTISRTEWRDALRLFEVLAKHCNKIIVVKGNHDVVLGPVAEKARASLVKEQRFGNILIAHGDAVPKLLKPDKVILIGHEHPAITLRSATRSERYRCFVKTTFKRRTLIVQPTFNQLTEGTDVSREEVLSPLLKDLSKAGIFVIDDKSHDVLAFGKLGKLVR
ncbi:metallophosphoesterase [Candidatus Woesearchaeota archaeon]|nr:metallophosphoesterase [Candidatus Woesearchaeota archaeon]